MTFAQRNVGADSLPARLSEFDVQQYFTFTKADVSALRERFRADRANFLSRCRGYGFLRQPYHPKLGGARRKVVKTTK